MAIVLGSVNLGYFSGTAQEGLIYIPQDGLPTLMIKKSLGEGDRGVGPLASAAKKP